jgi:gamma-glutamyltranspeptidase / glutathione hydrolase
MLNQPSWQNPSAPHPDLVYGDNLIATSEPHATEAGVQAFREGGNAVDAALAAAITLTVVEPTQNGIGGDGFSIVAHEGKLYGLNASGKSPMSWDREYFDQFSSMPMRGWDSVTTPGVVSQWVALHQRFGKLPFKSLFQRAITHARDGFPLSPIVAQVYKNAYPVFENRPEFLETWFPAGFEPQAGVIFKNPAQADTLQDIAETYGESFYRGTIANKIVDHSRNTGGWLTHEDLAGHEPFWTDTISTNYRSCSVHEMPPNGQGLVALIALGILNKFPLEKWDPDSADSIHAKVEAIKIGFAEAFAHVCDPREWKSSANELLSDEYFESRAHAIEMSNATIPDATPVRDHGTVYLSAADASGTMVSYIQSNYMGFGSGIVIPDTGISMQNRGRGFSLTRGHPNEVGPGKRPYHTIIPAMVTRGDNPIFAFGVMGAHMQPQGHVQVLTRILDNEWNPQASSDAPRWLVTEDYELVFEDGFDTKTIEALKHRGHRIIPNSPSVNWGGHQGIFKLSQGYCGSSDHRKDGHAAAVE